MHTSFQKVNKHFKIFLIKMKHQGSPSAKEVLNAVRDLPTSGLIAQENNFIFLKLDDQWIFNALEMGGLKECGFLRPPFFLYPPVPVGAHIKIVTKEEAEKYEVFEKRDVIDHLIGQTVDFEVVTAHVSYPRIKKYGIEARYKIRVRSPELSEIRKELTGLSSGPNNGHFVIVVGVRNPELNQEIKGQMDEKSEDGERGELEDNSNDLSLEEEFEKQLSPEEKHEDDDEDEDEVDMNDS